MISEVGDMPSGWPLGLDNMNMRLRVLESLQTTVAESYPFCGQSRSFSSFTSSDLDTESTRSFFHDKSISLGRLIKIKPGDGGDLYFTNGRYGENRHINAGSAALDSFKKHEGGTSCGLCIPLLQNVLIKLSPTRNDSRR